MFIERVGEGRLDVQGWAAGPQPTDGSIVVLRDTPASAQPRYIRDPWKGEAKFECALLHPTATGHLRAQM